MYLAETQASRRIVTTPCKIGRASVCIGEAAAVGRLADYKRKVLLDWLEEHF